MKTAYFNRFAIDLPGEAVSDMTGPGDAFPAAQYWADQLDLSHIAPDDIAAELSEYGAWDAEELEDCGENEIRILWIAAGNIYDEERNAE